MPKKKKESTEAEYLHDETETPSKPVPTFVTEVIEEESVIEESGSPEKSKEEVKDQEVTVESANLPQDDFSGGKGLLEEVNEPEPEAEAVFDDEKAPETVSEVRKQKQVVEELFTKKDSGLTEISVSRGSKKHSVFLWALIVIVAAVTTGLGLFFFSGNETTRIVIAPQPTPTVAPTDTPSPSPTPVVIRGDISVQVLNGGGIPGAASKMKSLLSELGYSVVDVGNTDEYSYDLTEIEVKPDGMGASEILSLDLRDEYTVGSVSATLDEDASYDARVIVGKE